MSTYDYEPDPRDYDFDDGEAKTVRCNKCRVGGFTWHDTGVRWALMDENGKLHSCKASAATDFDTPAPKRTGP